MVDTCIYIIFFFLTKISSTYRVTNKKINYCSRNVNTFKIDLEILNDTIMSAQNRYSVYH